MLQLFVSLDFIFELMFWHDCASVELSAWNTCFGHTKCGWRRHRQDVKICFLSLQTQQEIVFLHGLNKRDMQCL